MNNMNKIINFLDRYLYIIFPSFALLVIIGLMIYPMLYSIYLSFHEWQLGALSGPLFVGFANFNKLFSDSAYIRSLSITFLYSFLCLIIEIPFGMILALILNKSFKSITWIRNIFLLPILVTPVAISLIWVMMYNPSIGILNYFLRGLGLPPSLWISSTSTVIPSLVLVDVWKWTPLVALILLGGLKSLPSSPYEAVKIDGATTFQTFLYITVPLLKPTIMAALLIRFIDSLKTFAVIYTMTGGGPAQASRTTYLFAYDTSFKYFRMGYGSAAVMVFFFILLIISFALTKLKKQT